MGALSFSKSESFNRWNLFVCFEKTLCPIFESDKEFYSSLHLSSFPDFSRRFVYSFDSGSFIKKWQ